MKLFDIWQAEKQIKKSISLITINAGDAPFMERLTGTKAFVFAYSFIRIFTKSYMDSFAWCDTVSHWSPEALTQRKANRKLFFDMKYPDRPVIIQRGDPQWQN